MQVCLLIPLTDLIPRFCAGALAPALFVAKREEGEGRGKSEEGRAGDLLLPQSTMDFTNITGEKCNFYDNHYKFWLLFA